MITTKEIVTYYRRMQSDFDDTSSKAEIYILVHPLNSYSGPLQNKSNLNQISLFAGARASDDQCERKIKTSDNNNV